VIEAEVKSLQPIPRRPRTCLAALHR